MPRVLGILLVTVLMLSAAGALHGQVEASPRVTMDMDGVPIRQAIQFILHGRDDVNLVTGEALEETVTLKLKDVEWKKALQSVLTSHGYTFFEENGILRVMRTRPENGSAPARRMPLVIQLQHAAPESTRKALEPFLSPDGQIVVVGSMLSIVDVPANLEHIKTVVSELDQAPETTSRGRLVKNPDGTVDVELVDFLLDDLDDLLSRDLGLNVFIDGNIPGQRSLTLRSVQMENVLRLVLGEQGFGFRDDGNVIHIAESSRFAEARVNKQFHLQYVDALDVLPFVQGLLADGDQAATFSPSPRAQFEFGSRASEPRSVQQSDSATRRSRIISVSARPDTLAMITERIKELDVKPQQIEIEVKVVQLVLDESSQMGVDWNLMLSMTGASRPTNLPFGPHSGRFFPGSFPDPPTGFVFGQVRADELAAVIRMLHQTNDAEIISEPNITTLDNVEAKILVGTRFPVTTETLDPQTSVRTVTLDYYEDIGIQLNVIPSMSAGNRIHLIIHPAVSSLGELIEDRFPVINTREADTQMLLRSGETAIIGGLLETNEVETVRGVPILQKLPLIGKYLFQYQETRELKTELAIFVTPRLVLEGDQVTDAYRVDGQRVQALFGLRNELDSLLGR